MSTQQRSRIYCLRQALTLLMVICILDGLAFLTGTIFLHGDAANGKRDGEHYYLFGYLPEMHSKGYTEVTPTVYWYSLCHAKSVMVAGPLIPIIMLWRRKLAKRLEEMKNNAMEGDC